jgi:acid phosphatase
MKKAATVYFSFLLLVSLSAFNCSYNPANLDSAKKEVQKYYEEGRYDKEITEVVNKAINELESLKPTPNATAVFDIDETVLSNYDHIKSIGYGFYVTAWNDWMLSAKAKAIPQTKTLYDKIVEKGIKVVFITGRGYKFYDATYKNLTAVGFSRIDTLITRSEKENHISALEFKTQKRKELVQKGYNIVINVGDQMSDLDGGNSGIKVKLPDLLYYIQ